MLMDLEYLMCTKWQLLCTDRSCRVTNNVRSYPPFNSIGPSVERKIIFKKCQLVMPSLPNISYVNF